MNEQQPDELESLLDDFITTINSKVGKKEGPGRANSEIESRESFLSSGFQPPNSVPAGEGLVEFDLPQKVFDPDFALRFFEAEAKNLSAGRQSLMPESKIVLLNEAFEALTNLVCSFQRVFGIFHQIDTHPSNERSKVSTSHQDVP